MQWGVLLEKLTGMFAFCIYDQQRNTVIARDRAGEKIYYYDDDNGLIFASELKTVGR